MSKSMASDLEMEPPNPNDEQAPRTETAEEKMKRERAKRHIEQAVKELTVARNVLDGTTTKCEHCSRNSDVNRTEALLKRRLKSAVDKLIDTAERLSRPTREGLAPEDEYEG